MEETCQTCKYKVNGFYYFIVRIVEKHGLVYLKVGNDEMPVRIEDVEDISDWK